MGALRWLTYPRSVTSNTRTSPEQIPEVQEEPLLGASYKAFTMGMVASQERRQD